MSISAQTQPDAESDPGPPHASERIRALVHEGRYFVLSDFALRDETYSRVVEGFLASVEDIEGRACRERLASEGLGRLHRHFPAEKVPLLEARVLHRLRDALHYWSYRVGTEDLELRGEFFVDHLIVIRIHYPFLLAREAKGVATPPFPWADKTRAALADLKSWSMIVNRLDDFRRRRLGRWLGTIDESRRYDVVASYHKHLPAPARSHGPHVDTWYGHSYDGVNLWWSIQGVNEHNTVILYPEMFGQPMEYDPRSMYLAAGTPLPRPVKVVPKPGDLLLFNPETLHGTQVNISDETRVALTTRLNPYLPRFNPHADFHFQHWHSSTDLARRRFWRIRTFPKWRFRGEPAVPDRVATTVQRFTRIRCGKRLGSEPVAICSSEHIRPGEKAAVDLRNARVLLYRGPDGLRAFHRTCPHLGIDLADGHHDERRIFCPGHGVAFSLEDGSSHCETFALRRYRVSEREGTVYLSIAGGGAPPSGD